MDEPTGLGFRNFSASRWEDPLGFGRMSLTHKNSFEAFIDQKENEYRQEGLTYENNIPASPFYFEYAAMPMTEAAN